MKHGVLSLCAAWLVFALQAAAGQAPPVVRIPERVQCGLCQISIDTLATLGTIEGPGSLAGEPAAVRLDRLGRYWVVGAQVGVLVFESHGRRVHRVGRRGQGPGEFEYPAEAIPISGDSVVVLDGNRRATVIAPDLQAVRTIPLPYAFAPAIVLRWPDGLVANAIVRTPEGAGWPLHHLSLARAPAQAVKSFGSDRGELRPDRESWLLRHLAARRGGGFWTADRVRFRMHEWSAAFQHVRTFEREAAWFSGPSMNWIGNKDTPPPPLLSGILQDSAGIVWVAVHRPAPTWRSAWPDYPDGAREVPNLAIELERLYEVVLEAIDTTAGTVLARRTFPGYVVSLLPNRTVVLYEIDDRGVPRLMVLRFTLLRSTD